MKILDHKFEKSQFIRVFHCKICNSAYFYDENRKDYYFVSDENRIGAYYNLSDDFPKCQEIMNNKIIKSIIQ